MLRLDLAVTNLCLSLFFNAVKLMSKCSLRCEKDAQKLFMVHSLTKFAAVVTEGYLLGTRSRTRLIFLNQTFSGPKGEMRVDFTAFFPPRHLETPF
jgi:hypothetical protein